MIWLTWRQFRTQAVAGLALVVAFAAVYLATRSTLLDIARDTGYTGCTADCGQVASDFVKTARGGYLGKLYQMGALVLLLFPAVVGLFWGAPLVARELETGTHRLVWNQSISRDRWLGVKLGGIGLATAVFAGLVSWAITAWASPLDRAEGWVVPLTYAARGIVPIGYAVLAFVAGVTVGMVLRRTVMAMAVTLVVVLAAMAGGVFLREHLVAHSTYQAALPADWDGGISLSPDDPSHEIRLEVEPPAVATWVLSNTIRTSTGAKYRGPYDPDYCGPTATKGGDGPRGCRDWITSQNLQQKVIYIANDKFWALQWRETGLLLVASSLLAIFCFWWIRRRVA
jgi:ABC-type transport system involved in multi-copper enzyme maturation permease subunit